MNEKRKWIESQIRRAKTLPVESATEILTTLTPIYMEELFKDISMALGPIMHGSLPWVVATLDIYTDELRQLMSSSGHELVTEIKRLPRETIRVDIPTK